MYGVKKLNSVNDARYHLFQQKYAATKSSEKFLKNLTTFDSKLIPPCWKSLKQKMLRTIFVNSMWTKATDPCCVNLNPEDCGWTSIEGTLKPTSNENFDEIDIISEDDEEEDDNDEYDEKGENEEEQQEEDEDREFIEV